MNNIALQAENVTKYFTEPTRSMILNNISFSVDKGKFVTIMGKSGCGKSTLLYILSTLDTHFTGSLVINGQNLTGKSEDFLAGFRNENLGFVFQYHYLLPEFTVLENVMMPAMKMARKTRKVIQEEALELLSVMDMQDTAHKLAANLSGGQQQRVAIARALINRPGIIMADEPTGNLDSVNSSIVLDVFKKLSRNGITIIAVSHDPDFAAGSDGVIHMKDGTIALQAEY